MVELMKQIGMQSFLEQFADSPVNLAFVEALFAEVDGSTLNGFLEDVDDSAFSLHDWVAALRTLGSWLDVRKLTLSIQDQIGYVCCAAESASVGANLTDLPSLVDEMLTTYGCERAE